jgi:hypothetical protein
MPKAILEFTLPEEKEEFELAANAGNLSLALFDIQQEVWRPAYKHGYSDVEISSLIEKINAALDLAQVTNSDGGPSCVEDLIDLLRKKYYDILTEHDVLKYT